MDGPSGLCPLGVVFAPVGVEVLVGSSERSVDGVAGLGCGCADADGNGVFESGVLYGWFEGVFQSCDELSGCNAFEVSPATRANSSPQM